MKKILFIVISIALFAACSKESGNTANDGVVKIGEGEYAITAYFEDMTKASINSSSGAFSWDGTEQIAVWDSYNKEFVTFNIASGYTNSSARFTTTTAKANASFDGNVAYYPASIAKTVEDAPSYDFPTSHASLSAAAKSFPMQGTVTNGEINFSHLGSMISLTLNNVPSFTTELVLNEGSKDITVDITSAEAATGSISAVVPIPAGTYVLTVKLKDDYSTKNTFYQKARASKTYTLRYYYPTNPITLGYLLTFKNDANWASPKVHIWNTNNDSQNTDITTGGTYPKKLFVNNAGKYYAIMDNRLGADWVKEGFPIGVQFVSTSNPSNTTETSCVFLLRNIDFTIPSGGGIKTDYMVYPYKTGSSSTVSIKSVPAIITDWKTGSEWEGKYWTRVNIWDSGVGGLNTSWGTNGDGLPFMGVNGTLYYYDLEGKTPTKTFYFQFKRAGEGQTGDLTAAFTSTVNTVSYIGSTTTSYSTSIASKNVSLSTNKSSDNYLTLSSSYYGKYVLLKLGDSTYWPILVNRDYDYGY